MLVNGIVFCVKRTWLAHIISEHRRVILADRLHVEQECRIARVRSRGRLYLMYRVTFVGPQY